VVKVGRQTVFVGTTNQDQFLTDPTGNRRFLVIRVGEEVNVIWIDANRDQLWAEAYAAYAAGEDYRFTRAEIAELNAINGQYREHDVWEEAIRTGITRMKMHTVTIEDVITKILMMNVADATKVHRNRVADVLRALGCEPRRITLHNGERPYAYDVPGDLFVLKLDGRVTPPSEQTATPLKPLFGRTPR
jgi:predicted P-loop ATPase